MKHRKEWNHGDLIAAPPGFKIQEPPIVAQEPPPLSERPKVWPTDKPLPLVYRRQVLPCPMCRAVRMEDGGKAVVTVQVGAETAYLRCKNCNHRWQLPVGGE